MYRISLVCLGIEPGEGPQVAADVLEEFSHRPWQSIVSCLWDGTAVSLVGDSDVDSTGDALADEFSDAVAASWSDGYSVRIVDVKEVTGMLPNKSLERSRDR